MIRAYRKGDSEGVHLMDPEASNRGDADTTSEVTVRTLVDRRRPGLRSIYYGMFQPRRRCVRREEDAANAFLDWHPRSLLIVAIGVLLLSLIDGLITVRLVGAGVEEINPLMAVLVDGSPAGFALAKWFLTACGVTALVVAAHARVFGKVVGASVLHAVLCGYTVLVLYGLLLATSVGA